MSEKTVTMSLSEYEALVACEKAVFERKAVYVSSGYFNNTYYVLEDNVTIKHLTEELHNRVQIIQNYPKRKWWQIF